MGLMEIMFLGPHDCYFQGAKNTYNRFMSSTQHVADMVLEERTRVNQAFGPLISGSITGHNFGGLLSHFEEVLNEAIDACRLKGVSVVID